MNKFDNFLKEMIFEEKIVCEESKFVVKNRLEAWKQYSQYLFDDDLERLKTAMLKVFNEEDPKYDLDNENRIFAKYNGKKSKYSDDLRKGLATTLAFIGYYNDLLIHCSINYRKNFAAIIIREVFENITWKKLATLNPIFSFFAEADPDAFLLEMSKLSQKKNVIAELLNDENSGIGGTFHWTGILHSIEILAWNEEFLARAVKILTSFALLDKDNNVRPRPKEVLRGIFEPYFPQTLASKEKLVICAKNLMKDAPVLGWDILVPAIYPQLAYTSQEPKLRNFLPENFKNAPHKDLEKYNFLNNAYLDILLEAATENISLIDNLIRVLKILSDKHFDKAIEILRSSMILDNDDIIKAHIWEVLQKLNIKHRKFCETNWAMKENRLAEIDKIIEMVKPENFLLQKRHLFVNHRWDWYISEDWESEEKSWQQQQKAAVSYIYDNYDFAAIIDFVKSVENAFEFGFVLKDINKDLSVENIYKLLCLNDDAVNSFLNGYLRNFYYNEKENVLENFINVTWDDNIKTQFLKLLPFEYLVWSFTQEWLKNNEIKYWQTCQFSPPAENDDYDFAIIKSLKYQRPDLALKCFAWANFKKKTINFDLCIKTLKELVYTSTINKVDKWDITQLISFLQAQQYDEQQRKDLANIELLYMPLFNSSDEISAVTLNKALTEDPKLFHEAITLSYKASKNNNSDIKSIDISLKNTYMLLCNWNLLPGLKDNIFDYNIFIKWYKEVIHLCDASGHLDIAKYIIGEKLIYVPVDENGLWINKEIAALLDLHENEIMRDGYFSGTINSRGIHWVDFSGKEDNKLADVFMQKSKDLENANFINFAETLREISKSYRTEAENNIQQGIKRFKKEEL